MNIVEMEDKCSICHETKQKSNVILFDCDHSFHVNCIMSWNKQSTTCPMCRKPNAFMMTNWLWRNEQLTNVWKKAIIDRNIPALSFLHSNKIQGCNHDVLLFASQENDMSILDFLVHNNCCHVDCLFTFAMEENDLNLISYCVMRNIHGLHVAETIQEVVESNCLDIIRHLYTLKFAYGFKETLVQVALENGHFLLAFFLYWNFSICHSKKNGDLINEVCWKKWTKSQYEYEYEEDDSDIFSFQ